MLFQCLDPLPRGFKYSAQDFGCHEILEALALLKRPKIKCDELQSFNHVYENNYYLLFLCRSFPTNVKVTILIGQ